APPPGGRGSNPFRRAVRLARADRLRIGGGPAARDPAAGTVRPRPPSEHRGREGAARARVAVAGAAAGPDPPRPARVLARHLCGGAHRDARALSAPSVAGRSARRAADAARQAARHVRKRQTDKIVAIPARPRSARRRNSADASLALVNSWTAVWWDDAADLK